MATTTPSGVQGATGEAGYAPWTQPEAAFSKGPGGAAPMTHRQIMEALSGLLLGMFVAILSSTIVSNALPRDHHGPRRRPERLHLGRDRVAAGDDRDHAAVGQARRPVQQEAAGPDSPGHLRPRARPVAGLSQNTGMLIACRVRAGHRRGRSLRPRPDRDGRDDLPAGARPLQRLPRRDLRRRHRRRPAARRRHHRHRAGSAGAGASTSACPFAVIALIVLQKTLQLPRGQAARSRSTGPAPSSSAAAVSLLLVWVTFAGDKYDWISWQTYAMVGGSVAARRCSSSLVESKAERADHPAAAVPQPHHHAGLARLALRRRRDVRAAPSSSASTSSWRATSRRRCPAS